MGLFGDITLRRLENEVIMLGTVLRMSDAGALTPQAAASLPALIDKVIALQQQMEAKGKGSEAERVISAAKARGGSSDQAKFVFRAIQGGSGVEVA